MCGLSWTLALQYSLLPLMMLHAARKLLLFPSIWLSFTTCTLCSAGTPSVAATLADIQACYDCLRTRFSKQPGDIVLYGQSVGRCAPCCMPA